MVRRLTGIVAARRKTVLAAVFILPVLAMVSYMAALDLFHKNSQWCASCHVIDPYYQSWLKSDYSDHAHQEEDVVCKDCHNAPPQEIFHELYVYATGGYKVPLEERRFATAECFSCHKDYADLKEKTANLEEKYPNLPKSKWNPHDSHYGEVECRVCHKVHRPSQDFCSNCHGPTMTEAMSKRWEAARW